MATASSKDKSYRKQREAGAIAEKVLAQAPAPEPDSIPERVQGGDFAVIEKGGGAPLTKREK